MELCFWNFLPHVELIPFPWTFPCPSSSTTLLFHGNTIGCFHPAFHLLGSQSPGMVWVGRDLPSAGKLGLLILGSFSWLLSRLALSNDFVTSEKKTLRASLPPDPWNLCFLAALTLRAWRTAWRAPWTSPSPGAAPSRTCTGAAICPPPLGTASRAPAATPRSGTEPGTRGEFGSSHQECPHLPWEHCHVEGLVL